MARKHEISKPLEAQKHYTCAQVRGSRPQGHFAATLKSLGLQTRGLEATPKRLRGHLARKHEASRPLRSQFEAAWLENTRSRSHSRLENIAPVHKSEVRGLDAGSKPLPSHLHRKHEASRPLRRNFEAANTRPRGRSKTLHLCRNPRCEASRPLQRHFEATWLTNTRPQGHFEATLKPLGSQTRGLEATSGPL